MAEISMHGCPHSAKHLLDGKTFTYEQMMNLCRFVSRYNCYEVVVGEDSDEFLFAYLHNGATTMMIRELRRDYSVVETPIDETNFTSVLLPLLKRGIACDLGRICALTESLEDYGDGEDLKFGVDEYVGRGVTCEITCTDYPYGPGKYDDFLCYPII